MFQNTAPHKFLHNTSKDKHRNTDIGKMTHSTQTDLKFRSYTV